MFKRKKFMALCATTLAGISALGSFAPMAASADVAKNGDTVVTYEGAPKPAEWGLSVPSTIKLDKETDSGTTKWGYGKIAIVKEDGSEFSDTTKDRTFRIAGVPKLGSDSAFYLYQDNDVTKASVKAMITPLAQGAADPVDWKVASVNSGFSVKLCANFDIDAKSDNSIPPSRNWVIGIHDDGGSSIIKKYNYSNTMAWTATEKTS
ncbi:hypothetical protein [Lactococcus lactis]